jgi:hypothetical protein
MKLIRFGKSGAETPGVLLNDGTRLDTSSFAADYDEHFLPMPVWMDCANGSNPILRRRHGFRIPFGLARQ